MGGIFSQYKEKQVDALKVRCEKAERSANSYANWRIAYVMAVNDLCEKGEITLHQKNLILEAAEERYEMLQK